MVCPPRLSLIHISVIDQFTKCDGQLALFVGSELIQSQSFQHLMSLIAVSYTHLVNYGTAAGAELTISGFTTTYGGWASIFTAVALCCFAFSTIIGLSLIHI